MNWGKFKDPVSHLCLASAVIASWSLKQEMAGSNPSSVVTNIFSHFNLFNDSFRENSKALATI